MTHCPSLNSAPILLIFDPHRLRPLPLPLELAAPGSLSCLLTPAARDEEGAIRDHSVLGARDDHEEAQH